MGSIVILSSDTESERRRRAPPPPTYQSRSSSLEILPSFCLESVLFCFSVDFFCFQRKRILLSNQISTFTVALFSFSLKDRVGNGLLFSFLLFSWVFFFFSKNCLCVECLEQFALLWFVQSTAGRRRGGPGPCPRSPVPGPWSPVPGPWCDRGEVRFSFTWTLMLMPEQETIQRAETS